MKNFLKISIFIVLFSSIITIDANSRTKSLSESQKANISISKNNSSANISEAEKKYKKRQANPRVSKVSAQTASSFKSSVFVARDSVNMKKLIEEKRKQRVNQNEKNIIERAKKRLGITGSDKEVSSDKFRQFVKNLTQKKQKKTKEKELEKWINAYNANRVPVYLPPDNKIVRVPNKEHIPYFFVKLRILPNGSVYAYETIKILSEGKLFKNKISRLFPNQTVARDGSVKKFDITMESAKIDGKSAPYKIKATNYGKLLEIGNNNTPLSPGVHTVNISYMVDRQISFYNNMDELVWDVTGSNWNFVITRAGASVSIPQNADVLSQTGFTGSIYKPTNNIVTLIDRKKDIGFGSTSPLMPTETMTIIVSWTAGEVAPPDLSEKISYIIKDNGSAFVGVLGVLAVFLSYFISWLIFNKKKQKTKIITRLKAPENVTPENLSLFERNKFDKRNFVACLISMATKDYVCIEEKQGEISIIKTSDNDKKLSKSEKKVSNILFGKSATSIGLNKAGSLKLKRAYKLLSKITLKEFKNKFIKKSFSYTFFGIAMYVISVVGMALLSVNPKYALIISAWLSALLLCTAMICAYCFNYSKDAFATKKIRRKGRRVAKLSAEEKREIVEQKKENKKKTIYATILIILSVCFVLCSIFGLMLYSQVTDMKAAFVMALIPVFIAIFHNIFIQPSLIGFEESKASNGYIKYLRNDFKDYLEDKRINQGIKTFNQHYPYAVGVYAEEKWNEAFQGEEKPKWFSGTRELKPQTNNFGNDFILKIIAKLPNKM